MKLQVIFKACSKILETRMKSNPEASVKTPEGSITYKELCTELKNLETWCYKGEMEVQKIIRCKNCKNYKRYRKRDVKNPYEHTMIVACALDKVQRSPEYFCYYGEEKD